MNKLLVAAAATLALAACTTNPLTGVTTIGGVAVTDVQNDAVAICSLPADGRHGRQHYQRK